MLDSKEPGAQGEQALKQLFEIYWSPVYSYARRTGLAAADAEDAVQDFFLRALERKLFAKAEPDRGRLRNFLLTAFKHHLSDLWSEQNAQKRRPEGKLPFIEIDTIEERLLENGNADESPRTVYDREWAYTVLEEALRRLRERYEKEKQLTIFSALRPYLSEPENTCSHEALADSLGMKTSAISVALHRLRKRYREAMRATICNTLEAGANPEEEFKELSRILTQHSNERI